MGMPRRWAWARAGEGRVWVLVIRDGRLSFGKFCGFAVFEQLNEKVLSLPGPLSLYPTDTAHLSSASRRPTCGALRAQAWALPTHIQCRHSHHTRDPLCWLLPLKFPNYTGLPTPSFLSCTGADRTVAAGAALEPAGLGAAQLTSVMRSGVTRRALPRPRPRPPVQMCKWEARGRQQGTHSLGTHSGTPRFIGGHSNWWPDGGLSGYHCGIWMHAQRRRLRQGAGVGQHIPAGRAWPSRCQARSVAGTVLAHRQRALTLCCPDRRPASSFPPQPPAPLGGAKRTPEFEDGASSHPAQH